MKVEFNTISSKQNSYLSFKQTIPSKSMMVKLASEADTFLPNNTSIAQTKLYKKICNSISPVKAEDIEEVLAKMPKDLPRETLLLAMDKMTSYSNMKSIVGLGENIGRNNIDSIYDFAHNFENRSRAFEWRYGTRLNMAGYIPHSQPVPLSPIFAYLFNRGQKCGNMQGDKLAIILDSNTLEILKKDKERTPRFFAQYIKEVQPIYVENFENTYNVFEQYKDFAKETEKLARRICQIKKSNPQQSESRIADLILNRKNLKEIKALGLNPIIIKSETSISPTPQSIAEKMSPCNPTKEEFDRKFTECLAKSGYENDPKAREFLVEYLNDNLRIYSPKSLSEKLIELNGKIIEDVKAHGKPVDRIFYNVLYPKKSFGLISYMYQKANDIPENRFIHWNCPNDKFVTESLLKILPEDSTLVFLDDNMISGSCLLNECFPYEHDYYMRYDMKKLKQNNVDIVFANLLSFENVSRRLANTAKLYGREKQDRIVSIDRNKMDRRESDYFKILHPEQRRIGSTAILFPYMAPDNNAPNLRELFKLYYPQESFLKQPLADLYFGFPFYK